MPHSEDRESVFSIILKENWDLKKITPAKNKIIIKISDATSPVTAPLLSPLYPEKKAARNAAKYGESVQIIPKILSFGGKKENAILNRACKTTVITNARKKARMYFLSGMDEKI